MRYPALEDLQARLSVFSRISADKLTFHFNRKEVEDITEEFKALKHADHMLKLVEEQRGASIEDYNNAVQAARKLAETLHELYLFGDNLTKEQRSMISIALDKYQPELKETSDA